MEGWVDFWRNYVPPALKQRVRWCVDTAHLFAAGEYNLSNRSEVMRFYRDFSEGIGWNYLLCFHFNGSKTKFSSKKDNHADIGPKTSGYIETKGLRQLARIAGATGKPIILEVPTDQYRLVDQFNLIESWF
jgi:deoxyribonuclease-4